MKKMLLILSMTLSCFAVNLRLTKVVEDLNLYIFENKFVIESDRPIYALKVGNRLNINTDLFYNHTHWTQDVLVNETVKVGTTVEYGVDYTYVAEGESYSYTTDEYENQTSVNTYTFTPIGILKNKKAMRLEAFKTFMALRTQIQPLAEFTSVFSDINWFHTNVDVDKQSFQSASTGTYVSHEWLIDLYSSYRNGYKHYIYPIFDRNNSQYLTGVLNLAKRRKVFLKDHTYSLALFEYQTYAY
jgi:hypothetical protein